MSQFYVAGSSAQEQFSLHNILLCLLISQPLWAQCYLIDWPVIAGQSMSQQWARVAPHTPEWSLVALVHFKGGFWRVDSLKVALGQVR